MSSLYEVLSTEDRQKVDNWVQTRSNPQYDRDIPAEYYLAAELGYFYGWGAVEAFLRGYIKNTNKKAKTNDLAFTFEDAVGFVEAARKVHFIYESRGARKAF